MSMKAPMKLQKKPIAQRRLAPESVGGTGDCFPEIAAGEGSDVPEAEAMEETGSVRRSGRAAARGAGSSAPRAFKDSGFGSAAVPAAVDVPERERNPRPAAALCRETSGVRR